MRQLRGTTRIRNLLAGMPLRIKLVATVLVLATLGLAVAAVATTAALHSYLVRRLDEQLTSAATPIARGPFGSGNAPPQRVDSGPAGQHGSFSQFYVASLRPDGRMRGEPFDQVLDSPSPPRLSGITLAVAQTHTQPFTVPARHGGSGWRVIARVLPDGSGTLAVAVSLSDADHTVDHMILIEVAIGVGALMLMGGGGYLLIRRSLRPLVAVESTAAAIARGDLSRRVPELPARTEVGQLSATLNGMLSQIETAFDAEREARNDAKASEGRMRRFVADASHELRTPLTSIRGFAELYRIGGVNHDEEMRRVMHRIESEASRMGVLVEDLLLLARLDQQRPLAREPVDLLDITSDAVHDAQLVAPDRAVTLDVDTTPHPVVIGDDARLRQVVHNLMSNAVVHTPPGTPVSVSLRTPSGAHPEVVLEVADRGPGLPPDEAARVFERFYRADNSRSREGGGGGNGLGLSIVASIVTAHGGSVAAEPRPGGGAVFRVSIPAANQPVPAPVH